MEVSEGQHLSIITVHTTITIITATSPHWRSGLDFC
jgi:hypothetical protein